MGVAGERSWLSGKEEEEDGKAMSLCKIPFWQPTHTNTTATSFSSSYHSASSTRSKSSGGGQHHVHVQLPNGSCGQSGNFNTSSMTVSAIAKSLLPPRRRLRLDPSNKLFFLYEPGKQVRSAIHIKNICKSHVAFKFQTTAPKSCYMRPPGGILAPGETLVAVVFKFVEPPESNERPLDHKSKVKFKIMSLKVKADQQDYIPELFDEQKDKVSVEQILRVVFLDPEHPSPALEKLKRQLAEADAAVETRRKPLQEVGPRIGGEGLIIDEWKERRERYLAQQHGKPTDLP